MITIIFLILLVAVILTMRTISMYTLLTTSLGRLLLISFIILLTCYNSLLGLLITLIVIALYNQHANYVEGIDSTLLTSTVDIPPPTHIGGNATARNSGDPLRESLRPRSSKSFPIPPKNNSHNVQPAESNMLSNKHSDKLIKKNASKTV